MNKLIFSFEFSDKPKLAILQLLGTYIVFSEVIRKGAEVYFLEQTIEPKLLLFSLAVLLLYKVTDLMIILGIIFFLILRLFGVPTGFMTYTFVFYGFIRLLKKATRPSNE
mgnify:CR=1 FL=1